MIKSDSTVLENLLAYSLVYMEFGGILRHIPHLIHLYIVNAILLLLYLLQYLRFLVVSLVLLVLTLKGTFIAQWFGIRVGDHSI